MWAERDPKMTEEVRAMPPAKVYSEYERAAFADGWNAAVGGQPQHERRSVYKDYKDRVAFDAGWEARVERVAMGYDLPPDWETPT